MADKLTDFSNASSACNSCMFLIHFLFMQRTIVIDILISRLQLEINSTCSYCILWNYNRLGLMDAMVCCSNADIQFRSVAQSCPTLCDPMNRSTPGLPVHHPLPEFTETHVHQVSDAIQPSHPLSSPSPPGPNPSQHHSLFQWVNSSHEVAKVLEFQL